MPRTTLRSAVLVLAVVATLATGLPAAVAAAPPAAPTSATAVVGDRYVDLAWSGGSGTGAAVRDVTGLTAPFTLASGRTVVPSSATSARDTGFRNTGTATYAIWSTEADGTPSDDYLLRDVAAVPLVSTALTLTSSSLGVPYGRSVTFDTRLTRAGGAPVVGSSVLLYGRAGGTHDVRLLRRVLTGADGRARTTWVPTRSTDFFARFAGDAFNAASTSSHRAVAMRPLVGVSLTPSAIVRGESAVLAGRVLPNLAGAALQVQRLVGSSWTTVASLRVASTGTYRLVLAPGLGVYTYRVLLPATSGWLRSNSPSVMLRVDARDLSSGMRGDDVVALQRLLQRLHYEPGRVDGAFGYDLTHAVMAFQKVERLAVTGRWTKAERTRAGRPTAWRLRYPGPARAVEVSITRQVLVMSEAGRVVKIVDVSTGTEKPYTYEGVTDVAHTPRGRFSIERKIDGIRVSRLGELYRPSYFYSGWAIHGSGSVPSYPASHGCVRITNPNADRLFALLEVGTPVALYDE